MENSLVPQGNLTLTKKQRSFVEAYIKHPHIRDAALAAGYSMNTANKAGFRLVNHPAVKREIDRRQKEAQERNKVTLDYFIIHLKDIIEANDSRANEKVNALALLARLTGFLKDRVVENKQVVVLNQKGLEVPYVEVKPTS